MLPSFSATMAMGKNKPKTCESKVTSCQWLRFHGEEDTHSRDMKSVRDAIGRKIKGTATTIVRNYCSTVKQEGTPIGEGKDERQGKLSVDTYR
jgi:hypothetical protein